MAAIAMVVATAGMAFSVVMIAMDIGVKGQFAFDQGSNRIIGSPGNAAVELDAGLL